MSKQHVDPSKKGKERDPDLAAAEGAMKRAAQQARERAAGGRSRSSLPGRHGG